MTYLYTLLMCCFLGFMSAHAAMAPASSPTPLFKITYRDAAYNPRMAYIWASSHAVPYATFSPSLHQKIEELSENPNVVGVFEIDFSIPLEAQITELLRLYSAKTYKRELKQISDMEGDGFLAWKEWKTFYKRRFFPLIKRKVAARYWKAFSKPLHPRICWKLIVEGHSFDDIGEHSEGADHSIYNLLVAHHRHVSYFETEEERSRIEWPEDGRANYFAFRDVARRVITYIKRQDAERAAHPVDPAEKARLKRERSREVAERSRQIYERLLANPLEKHGEPDQAATRRTDMWTSQKLPRLLNNPTHADRIFLIVVGAGHVMGPHGLIEWFCKAHKDAKIIQYYQGPDPHSALLRKDIVEVSTI